MKIMMIALGTAGDVLPFIGVGRALEVRGHEVHLASLEQHRKLIEPAGLQFHPLKGVTGASAHPDFYRRARGMQVVAENVLLPAIRPTFELAANLWRDWRIISDPFSYGVRIAQELYGFPLITCVVSPFVLRSVERMPVTPGFAPPAWSPRPMKRAFFSFVSWLWDRQLKQGVNAVRQEVGLASASDLFYGWSLSPNRVIGLFPEWFAPRPHDWPPQFVYGGFSVYDQAEGGKIPEALCNASDPVVVFSAGSAGVTAESFFAAAIQASRGRTWRAVLLAPGYAPPERLPVNVTCCGYIALSRVLTVASVMVFHGGLGTMSLALLAGVPQIIVPFGHDQYDNAARAERLGVARCIHRRNNLASRVQLAVEDVLKDTAFCNGARALGTQADPQAGLATTCDEIERSCQ